VVGFDEISWLRANSPAWRLLRAENAPLVLSFLDQVFVAENIRSISVTELANRLDDELYALNERLGERTFPKPAKAYLDDWAAPEAGWLRKYYPEGSDEPHFDTTPAVEKALAWVRGLQARSFVGTESPEHGVPPAAADGVRRRDRSRRAPQRANAPATGAGRRDRAGPGRRA
jgi:hypothetical protein